jgi:hypothetical protein
MLMATVFAFASANSSTTFDAITAGWGAASGGPGIASVKRYREDDARPKKVLVLDRRRLLEAPHRHLRTAFDPRSRT